jgi:phage terminase large subunit-like protein
VSTILDAIRDPHLFAPWFKDPDSWAAWRAFLAAAFALPMAPEQLAIYQRCTGRTTPPTEPVSEAWLVCGRRAGKSFVLALTAVYLAAFNDYRRHLAPGERATILIIACDRRQARTITRYIRALLTLVPMLARMIEREAAESFDLNNSVTIEVGTASFKSVRGYAVVAALLDELAFWPTDNAAEPDYEILAAIRPGMAQFPNAMLLCASSPYARRGALWDAHRRHYAKDGDPVLVWQARHAQHEPNGLANRN